MRLSPPLKRVFHRDKILGHKGMRKAKILTEINLHCHLYPRKEMSSSLPLHPFLPNHKGNKQQNVVQNNQHLEDKEKIAELVEIESEHKTQAASSVGKDKRKGKESQDQFIRSPNLNHRLLQRRRKERGKARNVFPQVAVVVIAGWRLPRWEMAITKMW